jgi:hypothetical protein
MAYRCFLGVSGLGELISGFVRRPTEGIKRAEEDERVLDGPGGIDLPTGEEKADIKK